MAGCFSLDQNLNFSVSYNKIGSCGIQATASSRQEFDIARCGEQVDRHTHLSKKGHQYQAQLSKIKAFHAN